jgi:hypothetical protein
MKVFGKDMDFTIRNGWTFYTRIIAVQFFACKYNTCRYPAETDFINDLLVFIVPYLRAWRWFSIP